MFNKLLLGYMSCLIKERGRGRRKKGIMEKRDKGRGEGAGKSGRDEGKRERGKSFS